MADWLMLILLPLQLLSLFGIWKWVIWEPNKRRAPSRRRGRIVKNEKVS